MSTGWWTVARYGATVVLAALTAAYGYYPSVHWLPIAIATLGTLGIHVLPTAPPMYKVTVAPPTIPPGTYSSGSVSTAVTGEVKNP
jgi:hypothetical protein